MPMFSGLETVIYAYRSQLRSDTDPLFLFIHWYLVQHGCQCVVDGECTEILPTDWNSSQTEYCVAYSLAGKGFELKIIVVDDSVVINLMKKADERTANVTCVNKEHVGNCKNNFQKLFINLCDLHDKIDKEFQLLLKDPASTISEKAPTKSEESPRSFPNDPLRVGPPQRATQPYASPDNYGRSDLDPFGGFDPLRSGPGGSGGMIFDPFRGSNRPRIPGNLPPGAVPPGARFDPFGPPMPDDLTGGSPMRAGPNPSQLRPPQFEDPFM